MFEEKARIHMKKYKKGYTSGVYDLFHVGHLNIFKRAKEQCDYLLVGVSTDKVVFENKKIIPTICFEDRIAIVESIKYVDKAIPQTRYDIDGKIEAVLKNNIDVVFVGDDWLGTDKWKTIEMELKKIRCDVVYLPHTDGISSTILRKQILEEDE